MNTCLPILVQVCKTKIVEPCASEPPAHSSDDDEDHEEDSDGLFPALLRARFERQVAVNERLVNFFTEQF